MSTGQRQRTIADRRAGRPAPILVTLAMLAGLLAPAAPALAETAGSLPPGTAPTRVGAGRPAAPVAPSLAPSAAPAAPAPASAPSASSARATARSRAGRAASGVLGSDQAAVVFNGQPQDFTWDSSAGTLRHGWYDGVAWHYEILDGTGSPYRGAITDNVGQFDAVVLYLGQIHVWYLDTDAGTLRHAWWTGATWALETLDGLGAPGGNGRTGDFLSSSATVALFGGMPHVWYQDDDAGLLRHAWWNGATWMFESLDGFGVPGGNGRSTDHVGSYAAAVVYAGQPHVWYQDTTVGLLRHAWWTGATWLFESLDGTGSAGGNGRVNEFVGSFSTVVVYGIQIQVWYQDEHAHSLRHAWWNGSAWGFETLDGPGSPGGGGRVGDEVGAYIAAVLYGGQPHIWYQDATFGTLRHAWWSGTTWGFETLDGMGSIGGGGRSTDHVGSNPSVALYLGQPHVWYDDQDRSTRRHAWFTGAAWAFETL